MGFVLNGGMKMHIPDGYLAPQTAVPVFAGMVPVWAIALRKVKTTLGEKRIPSLALCAAFTFVLMMFNIPVAGGSSAHAVGAVFIAILLGPWAATASVSAALLIQALVFGDGGILSYGVNCLNMAVVMPFTGYLIYRLIAGKAPLGSRRSLSGALAGSYIGLNAAAFCAAFELGIQPLLFKSAAGIPLYCPYALNVSIPSMMLAHGVFAGPLEAVVTASALAYTVKFAPELFSPAPAVVAGKPKAVFFRRFRAFLIPLAVLAALSPLGLMASGSAWAEWSSEEINAMLGYIPKGLFAMADKWHALLPDYGLPFGGGAGLSVFGYILSAVVGMAAIAGLTALTSFLVLRNRKHSDAPPVNEHGR